MRDSYSPPVCAGLDPDRYKQRYGDRENGFMAASEVSEHRYEGHRGGAIV